MVLGLPTPDPTAGSVPLRLSLVCQDSGGQQRPNTHPTRGTPHHAPPQIGQAPSPNRPTPGGAIRWRSLGGKGRSIGVVEATVRRVFPGDAARLRALRLE